MPLYEYQCPDCQESFEKLVRSSAAADSVSCPTCGSAHPRRKLSTFAVKGSGRSSSAGADSAPSCAPGGL
ncbi:MAG: zinc ribbon domain-containing protein [Anaerolineae bacterium]|nr:zinc ribbon domain-containing protein [Anaerolineae bacterium]